ncbi:LamB/YcsF family protein [Methylocella sp.]|uniref:LamB/YcsF family protein n=1 Tax=Methylocella sp. TaxID=1978226 RepID=UPI003783413B
MSAKIDLNCDCGEGFGPYAMGDDEAMLDVVTSASVACGFHAGDPQIMARVFAGAARKGVVVGAHPGYPDLWGFGRRPQRFALVEIERLLAYQIGAAQAVAALVGTRVAYVKPHGALSNLAMVEKDVARALARAVRAVDGSLAFLAVAGCPLEHEARAAGLEVACEAFADRAYGDDGLIAPRGAPGAVLTDPHEIAARALAMAREGEVVSLSGGRLPLKADSICLHGDHPGAAQAARTLRAALEAGGVEIAPFARAP